MSDPLNPVPSLLMKIGSIVVHAEEALSNQGHDFDVCTILSLLQDQEVQQWIKAMGPLLPRKR